MKWHISKFCDSSRKSTVQKSKLEKNGVGGGLGEEMQKKIK